jgi:hypothetical protein
MLAFGVYDIDGAKQRGKVLASRAIIISKNKAAFLPI